MQHYRDRTEAGWRLAAHLAGYYGSEDVLVLAMTRGGVPVAYEVAQALGAQLDIFLVEELFLPAHEDRPIGIICSGGLSLFNDWVAQKRRIPKKEIESLATESQQNLEQREIYYRSGCATPELQNRILILVDDGLSSGLMFKTCVGALRQHQPEQLIIAIPLIAAATLAMFRAEADKVVCTVSTKPIAVASSLYDEAVEPTDEAVRTLLERSAHQNAAKSLFQARSRWIQ